MNDKWVQDVKTGRREISSIEHQCQGRDEVCVTCDDGAEIIVTDREAEKLLDASTISQATDLSFEDLVAALDGGNNER